jgi:carboxyl-terminal processing protease
MKKTIAIAILWITSVVVVLCIGFSAGVITDRFLLNGSKQASLPPTPVAASLPTPTTQKPNPDLSNQPSAATSAPTPEPTEPPAKREASGEVNLDLINEAAKMIQEHYVDQSAISTDNLTYNAISGMVDGLGDTGHSRFITAQELKSFNDELKGQFVGIGVYIETRDGNTVVVAPIDGSPAQKAGIQAGDIIVKVDGKKVTGLPLEQVRSLVQGPEGTKVTVTIRNPTTGDEKDITLTRQKINIQNVTWQKLPGTNVAHLRIASFSQGVTQDLIKALNEMKQQNVSGLILDLRNNPGGLADEAIGVASQFLSSGTVFKTKDVNGKVRNVSVRKGGVATDIPMVVMINEGSASASEIVTGALQDAGRAKAVGDTTFGTGTVLNVFNLSDGSALILAVEEWLTPAGRVIWHTGIVPDEAVKLAQDVSPSVPEAERTMTETDLQASKDAQLLKALDVLKSATQH